MSDVKFVGAWNAMNPYKRSALFARSSWCVTQINALGKSPCNMSGTIRVNGVQWAWAGWFEESVYLLSRDAGEGNATLGGWTGPSLLASTCVT